MVPSASYTMPDCFHKAQDDPKYSTLQLQSLLMGVAIGVVLTILLQVRWSFTRISPVCIVAYRVLSLAVFFPWFA